MLNPNQNIKEALLDRKGSVVQVNSTSMQLILVLAALVAVVSTAMVRYDNYSVFSVQVTNTVQEKLLTDLRKQDKKFDFWTDVMVERQVDIMVPPEKRSEFTDLMAQNDLKYSVKIENVQQKIDQERPSGAASDFGWDSYYRLVDINEYLLEMSIKNLLVVTRYKFGKSYEGRDLEAIRIRTKLGQKAIFIEANMNGNERITSAAITYFINELLKLSREPDIWQLAFNYDWIFVPVSNPDGFEYAHTNDPLWRKNRQPNPGSACNGTDLDRNFETAATGKPSFEMYVCEGKLTFKYSLPDNGEDDLNPCSKNYAGPSDFSTNETLSIRDFFRSFPRNYIRMVLSLRSYGPFVLYPNRFSKQEVPNADQLKSISDAFAEGAKTASNAQYTCGQASSYTSE